MDKKKTTTDEIFKSGFENHKKNNLEIAENLYRQAIKEKPNHEHSLFYLGGLMAQKKKINEAKELFEKVIKENPKYPNAIDNLSAIYRMLANNFSKNGNLLQRTSATARSMCNVVVVDKRRLMPAAALAPSAAATRPPCGTRARRPSPSSDPIPCAGP